MTLERKIKMKVYLFLFLDHAQVLQVLLLVHQEEGWKEGWMDEGRKDEMDG